MVDLFIDGMSDEEVKQKLRLFLNFLDRTITDSFCHANLGPKDSRAGRLILELEKELQNAVPNLTLKYDPEITPDAYAGAGSVYITVLCEPGYLQRQAEPGSVFLQLRDFELL